MSKVSENALIFHPEFQQRLGAFVAAWSSFDLTTDFAIWKFLNVSSVQAHLIVNGMTFGKKAKLLSDLIKRSEHPNKNNIIRAFNEARNCVDRDSIIHAYIQTDDDTVTFVTKNQSGSYKTKSKTFTLQEFKLYVDTFQMKGVYFHLAMGLSREEYATFAEASIEP
ncbi:hypothetical protein ACMDCR_09130 [Labrys okinawensis]|uniref:hypothetical protein n=1 Tax=Labrys okinawensis TaxID=346911 RepID=UPI0039BD5987